MPHTKIFGRRGGGQLEIFLLWIYAQTAAAAQKAQGQKQKIKKKFHFGFAAKKGGYYTRVGYT